MSQYFDEWIVVKHPGSQRPAALVLLRDTFFVAYIPLLDPRDRNGDGTVSGTEAALDLLPMIGGLSREAAIGNMMQIIAMDVRITDGHLYQQGQQRVLAATLVAINESFTSLYLGKLIGPAVAAVLGFTTLTGVSCYVVKMGMESVIKAAINRAMNH